MFVKTRAERFGTNRTTTGYWRRHERTTSDGLAMRGQDPDSAPVGKLNAKNLAVHKRVDGTYCRLNDDGRFYISVHGAAMWTTIDGVAAVTD